MKNTISKPALGIIGLGLILITLFLWIGQRKHQATPPANNPEATPAAAATPAPNLPLPVAAQAQTQPTGLAVIPISLTNLLVADQIYPDSAMKNLPAGTQVYGGIEFWLQGQLQLQSLATRDEQHKNYRPNIIIPLDETNTVAGQPTLRERGKGIACGYLLGGTRFSSADQETFAEVIWHYADGTASRSPLKYNVDLRDWTRKAYEDPERLPGAQTRVAWKGPHPNKNDRSLRLYRMALINPHPEKTIHTLEFASQLKRSSLFIAALTLDPLLPGARPDDLTTEEMADPQLDGQMWVTVQDTHGVNLANAEVRVACQSASNQNFRHIYHTDNAGMAQINFPNDQLKFLNLEASSANHSSRRMTWSTGEGDTVPSNYILRLEDATSIGGWVFDENNQPIGGATVRVNRFYMNGERPDQKGEFSSFNPQSVTTSAEGYWEAGNLNSNLVDRIYLNVQHPDFLDTNLNLQGSPNQALALAKNLKLVLGHGLDVFGQVVDSVGNPLPYAKVNSGMRFYPGAAQTNADDTGHFHFTKVPPGRRVFMASADQYAPKSLSVEVASGMEPIKLVLDHGVQIRGRVIDTAGKPLPDVHVSLQNNYGMNSAAYEYATNTDADGRFVWAQAPAKALDFSFEKSGYKQKENQLINPDQDNTITLESADIIHGW
ncbi:MAG TPA: carboxypeptidase-like regulatory domain-containing protein, partial [Verrucomicrobiae bacterium]